jgi:hypothetical protein
VFPVRYGLDVYMHRSEECCRYANRLGDPVLLVIAVLKFASE